MYNWSRLPLKYFYILSSDQFQVFVYLRHQPRGHKKRYVSRDPTGVPDWINSVKMNRFSVITLEKYILVFFKFGVPSSNIRSCTYS